MEILDSLIDDYKQLKICEEIAKDVYAPCYILSRLPLGRYYPIDLALTKNPNTSSETLDELFEKCNFFLYKERIEIVYSIVLHKHTCSRTLGNIIKEYKKDISILCKVASHPNASREDVKKLIKMDNQTIFAVIAQRNDIDFEISSLLFERGDFKVLYYLGMNQKCPIDVLEKIVKRFMKNEWHMLDMANLSNRLKFRNGGFRNE